MNIRSPNFDFDFKNESCANDRVQKNKRTPSLDKQGAPRVHELLEHGAGDDKTDRGRRPGPLDAGLTPGP